eukprot:COSAG01_NODE_8639_length_2711_cov_24.833461_3_plen_77_part_00
MVARINRDNWQFRLSDNFASGLVENMQLSKYSSPSEETGGEGGHYGWHIDTGLRGSTAKRRLSVSVQLSDPGSYVS